MRVHRVNNSRTRRHMYKHAHEILFVKQVFDRDDLLDIEAFDVHAWIMAEMEAHYTPMVQVLEKRMIHKYPQRRGTPPIETRFIQEVDIDFNFDVFIAELRYNPKGPWNGTHQDEEAPSRAQRDDAAHPRGSRHDRTSKWTLERRARNASALLRSAGKGRPSQVRGRG